MTISRKQLIEETLLRKSIRNILGKIHENRKTVDEQEETLRKLVRKMLVQEQATGEVKSTGIAELEDVLSQIVDTIQETYNKLKSDADQRESFRENLMDAVENLFIELDTMHQAGQALQEAIEIDLDDEDKFIEVRADKKKEEEEKGADAKEREGFGVEGMDETGKEYAFQVFKNRGVRQSIIDGYKNLKNDKDRKLFKDWMMINLNLYLKKFEEENFGQPDYEIPENPEALDEEPPMGGEEMPPGPDMGGEMMPPEDEEIIPPPSFE